jgi:hypothetical protein
VLRHDVLRGGAEVLRQEVLPIWPLVVSDKWLRCIHVASCLSAAKLGRLDALFASWCVQLQQRVLLERPGLQSWPVCQSASPSAAGLQQGN